MPTKSRAYFFLTEFLCYFGAAQSPMTVPVMRKWRSPTNAGVAVVGSPDGAGADALGALPTGAVVKVPEASHTPEILTCFPT